MKIRTFLLTSIAMLVLMTYSFAAVHITFEGNDLIAHSDQEGVAGFKGCGADQLEKVAAYTFRLLQRELSANNAICKLPSGRWRQVDERTSDNGSVIFESLPEGDYKVICLTGKAIGCVIDGVPEGYPERSIVYAQEVSQNTAAKKKTSASTLMTPETGLLIFPNPAQAELNVQVRHTEMKNEVVLVIHDLQGKQLYHRNYEMNEGVDNQWKIGTEHYPSGTYLLRVFNADGLSVEGKFQVLGE